MRTIAANSSATSPNTGLDAKVAIWLMMPKSVDAEAVPTSGATYQILTFGALGTNPFARANLDPAFVSPETYDPTDVTVVAI